MLNVKGKPQNFRLPILLHLIFYIQHFTFNSQPQFKHPFPQFIRHNGNSTTKKGILFLH